MPKRQKKAKSARVLIRELILLFKNDWEEDQILAFLATCKKNKKDKNSSKTKPTKSNPLHILVTIIFKANIVNLSNFFS